MESYELIVVGLGAVGSATVRHLANSGTQVVGIDRFAPPHPYGSTHGDTRITREAVGEGDAYVPFVRRSHELWDELGHDSGVTLLRRNGGLIVAPESGAAAMHGTDDFAGSTIGIAERHGIQHEVLTADELRRRFPQFRAGDDDVGYYEPGAGAVMADDAVRVQLDLAERQGASIRRGERVLHVRAQDDGVTVVTDRASYGADVVVLAPGAWLPEYLEPELAGLFTVYRQVQNWFELDGPGEEQFDPDRCPVFIWQFGSGGDDMCYGFPAVTGRDGGVKIGTESYRASTDPESVRRDVDPAESAQVYEHCLSGRFPGLAAKVVRSVSCLYTVTPDFDFVVDRHPEHANIVLASGCSGHGFKHSAALGEAVGQFATSGAAALDLTPFALSRFDAAGRDPGR